MRCSHRKLVPDPAELTDWMCVTCADVFEDGELDGDYRDAIDRNSGERILRR